MPRSMSSATCSGVAHSGPPFGTCAVIAKRRAVVYTPWFWWLIMLIIRNLPRPIFDRMKI